MTNNKRTIFSSIEYCQCSAQKKLIGMKNPWKKPVILCTRRKGETVDVKGILLLFFCILNSFLLDLPSFVQLPFLQSECLSTPPTFSPTLRSPFGCLLQIPFQFLVLYKYHFSSLMFVIISVNPPNSSPVNALNCMVTVSIIQSPMLICLI